MKIVYLSDEEIARLQIILEVEQARLTQAIRDEPHDEDTEFYQSQMNTCQGLIKGIQDKLK